MIREIILYLRRKNNRYAATLSRRGVSTTFWMIFSIVALLIGVGIAFLLFTEIGARVTEGMRNVIGLTKKI